MGRRAVLGWVSILSSGGALWMYLALDADRDGVDLRAVDPSWLVMVVGLLLLSAVTGSAWAILMELGKMQGERQPRFRDQFRARFRFRSPIERLPDSPRRSPDMRIGRHDQWS